MPTETMTPAFRGTVGAAFRIEGPFTNPQTTSVVTFFLNLPRAHPFWWRYQLSIVHLRDVRGVKPANKRYPEAEYELALIALDPERNPVPDDIETWVPLQPLNMVIQFHGATDDQAAELGTLVARALVDGVLPAEPDDYQGSHAMWENTVRLTLDHITGKNAHVIPHEEGA